MLGTLFGYHVLGRPSKWSANPVLVNNTSSTPVTPTACRAGSSWGSSGPCLAACVYLRISSPCRLAIRGRRTADGGGWLLLAGMALSVPGVGRQRSQDLRRGEGKLEKGLRCTFWRSRVVDRDDTASDARSAHCIHGVARHDESPAFNAVGTMAFSKYASRKTLTMKKRDHGKRREEKSAGRMAREREESKRKRETGSGCG